MSNFGLKNLLFYGDDVLYWAYDWNKGRRFSIFKNLVFMFLQEFDRLVNCRLSQRTAYEFNHDASDRSREVTC